MTVMVVIGYACRKIRHVSKCPSTGETPTGAYDGPILDEHQTLLH